MPGRRAYCSGMLERMSEMSGIYIMSDGVKCLIVLHVLDVWWDVKEVKSLDGEESRSVEVKRIENLWRY